MTVIMTIRFEMGGEGANIKKEQKCVRRTRKRLFIHSFFHSFIHSFIQLLICGSIHENFLPLQRVFVNQMFRLNWSSIHPFGCVDDGRVGKTYCA